MQIVQNKAAKIILDRPDHPSAADSLQTPILDYDRLVTSHDVSRCNTRNAQDSSVCPHSKPTVASNVDANIDTDVDIVVDVDSDADAVMLILMPTLM